MKAQTIRFLVQLAFAFAALAAVVLVPSPYGPTLGFFLLVFGLWAGRRIFRRIALPKATEADPRKDEDEGP